MAVRIADHDPRAMAEPRRAQVHGTWRNPIEAVFTDRKRCSFRIAGRDADVPVPEVIRIRDKPT